MGCKDRRKIPLKANETCKVPIRRFVGELTFGMVAQVKKFIINDSAIIGFLRKFEMSRKF